MALSNSYYGLGQLLPADSVLTIAQSLFPDIQDETLKMDILLGAVSEIVKYHFDQGDLAINDGMDIALVSVKKEKEGYHLKYAGANNPLWVIKNETNAIKEIKATKRPIGKYINPIPYKTSSLALDSGDLIYLFSDGFADQFGGEKGKKYKYSALKKFVSETQASNIGKTIKCLQK